MKKSLPFSAEVSAISGRQRNSDGSVEFTCSECGMPVFCAVDDGFEFPVCLECRFFNERPFLARPKRTAER